MQELYAYYKETAKWDTAISILKLILEIDSKDSWARKEITECFRGKYADHSHLEDYIKSSNLNQSFRNVFEAINDFEKHIAFDAKNYVYHRTWGVGIISKVEGDILTINFGKKTGVHTMSLKMAVSALQPLAKDHIKVYKKTVKHEELVKKVKSDIPWTLKTIIKSYNNNCDEKHIKAELVPSILKDAVKDKDGKTKGSSEWTSWHAKAQKILAEAPFCVNPNDANFYTVRDRELSKSERLANEFKANKEFFPRIDIMARYLEAIEDPSDDQFSEMFSYFANYLKAFTSVNEQTVASYLVVQEIVKRISALENQNAEIVERLETLSKVSEEYSNAKSVIERNNREIEAAQARLGAAFLDARKYSENLVAAANEKAHAASKTISEDISKQASEITRLSSEVDKISAIFTKSVDELQANISILAQRMAATAKNLSIRQDAVFEPDLSLSFEVDDDASGVLETNDGSGLTYIQYPPHTDFHEDLNIKPDSFPFNTKEG